MDNKNLLGIVGFIEFYVNELKKIDDNPLPISFRVAKRLKGAAEVLLAAIEQRMPVDHGFYRVGEGPLTFIPSVLVGATVSVRSDKKEPDGTADEPTIVE